MWGCNYNGPGLGHWFFADGMGGFAVTMLISIVIGALVYKIFRFHPSRNSGSLDRNDTLEILNIRFARGEISEQEYQNMKKNIQA